MKPEKTMSVITVERFDPAVMREPEFQTYRVPFEEGLTVMDALLFIHGYIDGSLAFRASCQCGLCLVCWIQIDGKTACPCKRFMREKMILKPMPKRKVIKDLVVELDPGDSIHGA